MGLFFIFQPARLIYRMPKDFVGKKRYKYVYEDVDVASSYYS